MVSGMVGRLPALKYLPAASSYGSHSTSAGWRQDTSACVCTSRAIRSSSFIATHTSPSFGGAALAGATPRRRTCLFRAASVHDHAADRFAPGHQIKAFVDLLQLELVGDEVIDIDLLVHVPVDDAGHLRAAATATEGRALPAAASDELERAGRDLLPRGRHSDDRRYAPAAMAALERLAHELRTAHALEAVVGTAAGELDQIGHQIALDFLGVDEVREPELARQRFALVVQVDADDLVGTGHLGALNDIQADAAEAEHHHVRARFDLGGPDHRADAGRDAAADVEDLVERGILAHLRQRNLRHHGVVGECRATHVVQHRLTLVREAGGAIGHEPLALGGADLRTEVGLVAGAGS